MMRVLAVCVLWLCAAEMVVVAQEGREPKAPAVGQLKTIVSIELLTPPGEGGLDVQRWGAVLSRLGASFQSRQVGEPKPEIRERKQGTLRYVTVVAVLSGGNLIVPGKKFSADREQALGDWLRELETYGAQGRPDGKPAFGLSADQFDALMSELEAPITIKTNGKSFDVLLKSVASTDRIQLRLTAEATERVNQLPRTWSMSDDLSGLSRGTGTAILLAQVGLGFRPNRTPAGTTELLVVSLDDAGIWPIGWPLDRPPLQSLPTLVQAMPIEFDDVSLDEVFKTAAQQTGVRVLVDRHRIASKNIDLKQIKITQPPSNNYWSIVLQRVTGPHRIIRELLVDEAGTAFVWMTTMDPKRLGEREKQREALMLKKEKAKK